MEKKGLIRKKNIDLRRNMTKEQVENFSRLICTKLINSNWVDKASGLFLYSASNNEVDLKAFIEYAKRNNIRIAFPKVRKESKFSEMDFFWVDNLLDMKIGSFNIMEPVNGCELAIPDANTWIMVPGVAFSMESGYRIGYGKGYYDRYLSNFPGTHTIGIAYEQQLVATWSVDKHDIAMEQIITEKREVLINDKT